MTRLLVLGMLDMQPMSGYDIQQMLRMTDAERWSGVLIGSIYHALKKMEQEGYVEISGIEHSGHRQKAIYRITDRGTEHLKQLVQEALTANSATYPSTLYAGISFYNQLAPEEARRALKQQQRALNEEYDIVAKGLKAKNEAIGQEVSPMVKLVFDNMFSIIKLQQDFVEKALKLL